VTLDPRTHAVRPDLADIRLAGQVFAPHFAAPLLCRVVQSAVLRDAPLGDSLAELKPGEPFEVLDFSGTTAWGRAPGTALVGYVDRTILELA
jgi:hypothetical protein